MLPGIAGGDQATSPGFGCTWNQTREWLLDYYSGRPDTLNEGDRLPMVVVIVITSEDAPAFFSGAIQLSMASRRIPYQWIALILY